MISIVLQLFHKNIHHTELIILKIMKSDVIFDIIFIIATSFNCLFQVFVKEPLYNFDAILHRKLKK